MFSQRLSPQTGAKTIPHKFEKPDVKSKDSQLLDYIYSINPVTDLPQGDLAVYLGDKANPEIKNFIQMNLLHENVDRRSGMRLSQDVLNKFREHITDDDIAAFSRNHGESKEEYADRMKLYMLQEKQKRSKEAYERKLKSMLESNE